MRGGNELALSEIGYGAHSSSSSSSVMRESRNSRRGGTLATVCIMIWVLRCVIIHSTSSYQCTHPI